MSHQYPVDLNIRLKPPRGAEPTKADIREVLRSIMDEGSVPTGWRFAAISWRNPDRASRGWKHGTSRDLDAFLPVLRDMGIKQLMESFRVGAVSATKSTKARRRKAHEADQERRAWRQQWQQARRNLDRSKLPETRRKWRHQADEAREQFHLWDEDYERLSAPQVEEYEVAASYP